VRDQQQTPGLTVPELAKLLRVGEDKVRGWIRRGALRAVNVASRLLDKPRWVVLPVELERFLAGRQTAPAIKPARRQKRRSVKDYYPD
jgi:excisionase family DNA binding protein